MTIPYSEKYQISKFSKKRVKEKYTFLNSRLHFYANSPTLFLSPGSLFHSNVQDVHNEMYNISTFCILFPTSFLTVPWGGFKRYEEESVLPTMTIF